jgi:hypothetical protein
MTDHLDSYEMRGDVFAKLLSFAFAPDTDLDSWRTPIHFAGPTYRLYSPHPGPSGLFAVLQAHIILNAKSSPKLGPSDLLVDAILDVMSQMRGGQKYIICQVLNVERRSMTFLTTIDRETARLYLHHSGFLQTKLAALLLALSFVCLAGPAMLNSLALREPLIALDGSTSARFVWLLITGVVADHPGRDFRVERSRLQTGVMQKQAIGYLIERDGEVQPGVGEALERPEERIWVRDLGGKFDLISWDGSEFRLFDSVLAFACESRRISHRRSICAHIFALRLGIEQLAPERSTFDRAKVSPDEPKSSDA